MRQFQANILGGTNHLKGYCEVTSCWEHALEWDVPKKVVQIKKIDSETTSYRIRFWYKGPFGGGVCFVFFTCAPATNLPQDSGYQNCRTPVQYDSESPRSKWRTGRSEDKRPLASGKTNQQPICVIQIKVEFAVMLTTENTYSSVTV